MQRCDAKWQAPLKVNTLEFEGFKQGSVNSWWVIIIIIIIIKDTQVSQCYRESERQKKLEGVDSTCFCGSEIIEAYEYGTM